jgi:hypothetical protein
MPVKHEILALSENITDRVTELSAEWDPKKARQLVKDMDSIKAKTGKRFREIKKVLCSCSKTLSGVIEGRRENLLNRAQAMSQMKAMAKSGVKTFLSEVASARIVLEEEHLPSPSIVVATQADKSKGLTLHIGASSSIESELLRQVHAGILESDHPGEVLSVNLETSSTDWEDSRQRVMDEKVIKVLSEYDEKVNKLPRRLTAKFKMVKAPVIPIAENWTVNKPEKLKQAGIKALHIDQWVILDDQFLLGLNPDMLSYDAKIEKKPLDKYMEEYVKAAIKRLNAELNPHERFQLFSNTPQKHYDVVYYWLMQVGKVDAWRGATGLSSLKVMAWGFAKKDSSRLTDMDIFDKHIKEHEELVTAVNKYKRQELPKNDALQRFKILIHTRQGKELDSEMKSVFESLWKAPLPGSVTKKVKSVPAPKSDAIIDERTPTKNAPPKAPKALVGKPKLKKTVAATARKVIKVRRR